MKYSVKEEMRESSLSLLMGDPIEQSERLKYCKHDGCSTLINGYRTAIGADYCTQHEVENYEKMMKAIERKEEIKIKKKRKFIGNRRVRE